MPNTAGKGGALMRVVICEDSEADRRHLVHLCESYCVHNEMPLDIEVFADGEALLASEGALLCDVVLMDIYLDKSDGVDIARALRAQGFSGALIFCTSSTNHYADGFDLGAVHYLIKPIGRQGFFEGMDRALRQQAGAQRMLELLVDRIPVRVAVDNIIYIEVLGHTVHIHTKKQALQSSITLREMEDRLLADSRFVRCHRCYIVNLDYAGGFDDVQSIITMNGQAIPVSRRAKKEVKRQFLEHSCL